MPQPGKASNAERPRCQAMGWLLVQGILGAMAYLYVPSSVWVRAAPAQRGARACRPSDPPC
jgi:hypothetical protein